MVLNEQSVFKTNKSKKENVLIMVFIAITLLSGWIGYLVDFILPDQPDGETLGMGIWLLLPFLCGIVIRLVRRDWKDFGVKPNIKTNIKWYALSVIIFPAMTLMYSLLGWIFGFVEFNSFSVSSLLPIIGSLFVGMFIKNIFEDFAWQGFLTPKLVKARLGDLQLYLVVGLVWAFWHAPYYLHFLPDSFYSTTSERLVDVFIKSPIIITVWGVMFVEMTRITRSVWPAVLMHALEDAIPNFLIFEEGIIQFNGIGNLLLNPLTGLLPLATYLVFGLWLRKMRISKYRLSKTL
jgi:hypothetical protein